MSKIIKFIGRNRTFVYISASLLFIIILLIIIVQIIDLRRSNAFRQHIRRAETLVLTNRIDEALQNLNKAGEVARSVRDYLQVIARAEELDDGNDGIFNPAANIIIRARKNFPRNQDIIALYVNSLLRQSDPFAAAEAAEKLNRQPYLSLKSEAFLKAGKDLDSRLLSDINTELPLSPEKMADPQAMLEAGLLTGDIRYFVNAVVMYAALGKIREAFAILMERRALLENNQDAIVLLTLAYDLGEYETVYDVSPLLPADISTQANMMLADLYFYRGEIDKSYAIHQAIADRDPAGLSYLNQFNLVRGHAYEASLPVTEALEAHRDNALLLAHFLASEAETGGTDVFRNSLNYYQTLQPTLNLDWIEQLQKYFYQEENYRIKDSTIVLWHAINNNSEDVAARNLLLYFLSLDGDNEDVLSLLQRYNFEYDDVLLLFHAVLSFSTGKRGEARKYFLLASERDLFQASFNLGLLDLEDRNFPEARKWFLLAARQAQRRTGFSLEAREALYNKESLSIRLYEGIVEALAGNNGRAREIAKELDSLEFQHLFLPRLKEMVGGFNSN